MDGLRWWLLVFGLIVVAAVYLYTRFQRKRAADSPQRDLFEDKSGPARDKLAHRIRRVEPVLQLADDQEPAAEQAEKPLEPFPEQKIVTLRVVARDSAAFAGDELVLCLRRIGMRHGKFGIFHRPAPDNEKESVFSAASLVEPGSFDLANIKEQQIPGISLFLVLPGPVDGVTAFDMMMGAARDLTQSLNAELLDETGSTLSIQRERYLREEVIKYEHSLGVA